MREVALERYRNLDVLAGGGASAAALLAIFLAGERRPEPALLMAIALAGAGLGLRVLLGDVDLAHPSAAAAPHRAIAGRLFPFYVLAAMVSFVLFPEPFGPRALYLMAFAQAPLLALSGSGRGRAVADANAGILAAAALAAGGPFVRIAGSLWLALLALSLAARHWDERSHAARHEGEEDLAPPLLAAGGAALLLLAVFHAGALLLPSPRIRAFEARTASELGLAEAVERTRLLPARAIAALALACVLPFALIWAYRRIADWLLSRRAPGTLLPSDDEGLALSSPEGLDPEPPPTPAGPPATRGRAGVVAAYLRLEEALAARDLGRAPSEGALEHAATVGERFPGAATDLAEVARRFSEARYGGDEPPAAAPREVREAAERAVAAIDGEG